MPPANKGGTSGAGYFRDASDRHCLSSLEPNIAWVAFKVMNLALEALDCYQPLGSSVVRPIMRIIAQFQPVSTNRQGLIELASRFELVKSAIDKLGEDGLHEESRVTVDSLRRELESLMDDLNDNQSSTDDVTNAHLQARLEQFFNHTDSASPLRKHNMALAQIISNAMSVPVDEVLDCLHNLQRSKLSQVSQGEDDRAIPAAPSAIINNYYISGGSGGSGGRGGETGGSGGTGEGPRFIYKTYIGYQSRPEGILPRRSELPDDRWVASIVEKIISDRETSATQLRPLDNTLLIRLDYARLIPSRANLNFLRRLICSLSVLSADEQAMIRGDMAALLPVLTTTAVTDIERTTFALSGLAAAINPTTAIGLYTQTLILYIAAYIIWRLVVQITRSIPSAPGIDTKHTIVVIDILGLEFRLPLERCVTFEDFHSLMVERASERRNKSAAKYVLSRAYEVTDGSNSAVIYPHIWARKIRAGIKLEMAVLLHRRSVTCPWCGQENTQALWIHCDCGRTFEVSAASQMRFLDHPEKQSAAFIEELPESSQHTSSPIDIDSFPAEKDVTNNKEVPTFRKVHVIFDDSKGKLSNPNAASNDVLSWTNQDPRQSVLFNSWGVLYRFQTKVAASGQSVTTLWRAMRPNKEDRVAKLEWAMNGGLGRVVIGKNTLPMADLVQTDPRIYGSRVFIGPDGLQYRWRPSSNTTDIVLQDSNGVIVAFFRPTRQTRYQIGDVYGEIHFIRTAGSGTVMHPPIMDTVTVTAMLYRFCAAWDL